MHVLSEKARTSLYNVTTRFRNVMEKHFPRCEVCQIKESGKWYMTLFIDGVGVYSYHIAPVGYSSTMYRGHPSSLSFLFNNDPENASNNKVLSHKRMFEKLLEHMYLERLQNQ